MRYPEPISDDGLTFLKSVLASPLRGDINPSAVESLIARLTAAEKERDELREKHHKESQ